MRSDHGEPPVYRRHPKGGSPDLGPAMGGSESQRDKIHAWLCDFLWEFFDSGMDNSEAADVILGALETTLPIGQRNQADQLKEPVEIFRAWKSRED